MIKVRNQRWHNVRRFGLSWYKIRDPEFGFLYGSHPGKGEDVVRMGFYNRPSSSYYQGRRSYEHQPKRWMKVGWYAEYMRKEWGAEHQKFGCRNMRLEKIGHAR